MVSVMENDFELERNVISSSEVSKVSNNGHTAKDERVDDLGIKGKIRVSSREDLDVGKIEFDETRVFRGMKMEMNEARVLGGGSDYIQEIGNFGNVKGEEAIRVLLENDEGKNEVKVKEDEAVRNNMGYGGQGDGDTSDARMRWKGVWEEENKMDVNDVDDEMRVGTLKIIDDRFEIGDMVWGKVKSHPWWPGHLFDEALANSSVRRTRRHGHMLVAFFGDSSYGWFDPTELVPYDPHYAEKAQQTTSKNFVRAVEDSIDEVSRRSALGLSCYCRNPSNFRPANVYGYVAVDVVDYEPGAIYSVSQIQKARDSFQPKDTLSFIQQLAVAPMNGEIKNLDFIKYKAITLAYRRSKFEEFDETYAQAFTSHSPGLPEKGPSRAPLSGPLVMADTLGRKSTKVTKTKEQSKKDRYLFKRRDELGDLKTTTITPSHASSSSSSALEDRTSDTATAAYVFQKRGSDVLNDGLGETSTMDQVANSARAGTTKNAPTAGLDVMVPSGSQELASSVVTDNVHEKIPEKEIGSRTKIDSGHLSVKDSLMKKKKKAAKRPIGEQGYEKSVRSEKKLKKIKKKDGQRSIELGERDSVVSGGVVKPAGMPTEFPVSFRVESRVSQWKKEYEATNSCPPVGLPSLDSESDLSQILADLRGLAQNPVHGIERNRPAIVRQYFLKFRSLVYLKSSSVPTPIESVPNEAHAIKSSEPVDKTMESSKGVSSLKLQRLSAKQEDPAKAQKRIPSERQEEKAAKRAKKISEVKSLSAEKKGLLKNPEVQQQAVAKVKVAGAPSSHPKPMKTEQGEKKMDRPPRVEEPTLLIMKYSKGASLPSMTELKARFARFGQIDLKQCRVFYSTNTCRVAFLYKQDANVAYRYAMGSKSVFSNVKFLLKPLESQQANSSKVEDAPSESSVNPIYSAAESRPMAPTPMPQQSVPQLKSCLKKPSGGDDIGGTARAARVRFNLVDVKDSNDIRGGLQGQKLESRNSMLSSYEGPSSSPSSSVAMHISYNQRLNVSSHPLQPPLLPLLPQFISAHVNPMVITPLPLPENQAPPQPTRDISHHMMTLLTRCHDVVTNIKKALGYMPYHAL
ncbi:PWWP domain-containing protein 1-like [Amaranthus tricolor]|uniref:PWWP domain-containing protein 1-like n=1 Tax=Amaranthus tricolor TaxID=29722 RepID=UPI002586D0DE|nr:PWWP domain-containing protein 1-like [Amaranthus tricolor]